MLRYLTSLMFCLVALPAQATTFFDTDFETCTVGTGADFPCEGWDDVDQELVDFLRVSTVNSFSGSKSVRLTYDHVNGSSEKPSIWRSFTPTKHLFTRFASWQAANFQVGSNGVTKRVRFRPDGGYPVFSVWMGASYFIATEGIYDECTQNFYGGPAPTPSGWDQIELEVKLNTPGQANGETRLWVNGTLHITVEGREFVGPTPTSVNGCNTVGPSTNQFYESQIYLQSGVGDLYYDRFAVGDTRVGLVEDTPPVDTTSPNAPTNLVAK